MKRTITNLVFLSLSILLCYACSRSPETAGNSTGRSQILRIATSFKIQNLDPLKSGHYFLVEYGVAELPLILDNNNLKPWVLESYAQIDELNWRLILRPSVKFQNGKVLTAEKLAAAMNRQLINSPSTKAIISDASVKVMNERELILTTEKPNPNVPAALADEDAFPIYDIEGMELAVNDSAKLMNCQCYTGAYKIAGLDDREMRLEKFNDYWRGTPKLDGIRIKFISDSQARILAVESDEADLALYPPTESKRILANRQDAFFITENEGRGGPRLLFNVRRTPFDDEVVRRAASLGINYESLAKDVMDNVFETATGFYSPVQPFAIQNQKTNREKAKQLLNEAGWTENTDGVRTKNNQPLKAVFLVYPQQPDWITLATAMQAQLKEIGFDIKIRQVDDINAAMKNPTDWNAAINSPGFLTTGGAPDPYLREYLSTGAERNYGGVSDAELDRLINQLSRTFDETNRAKLLKRIQEIIIAEKAFEVRPVFSKTRVVVGRNYRNYKPSPLLHYITYETKPDDSQNR